MAGSIVVCCDGTWCGPQTRTKTNTKILADSFARASTDDRVNMYDQPYKRPNDHYDKTSPSTAECYSYHNSKTDTQVLYMPGCGLHGSSFESYLVDCALALDVKRCCVTVYKFIAEHFNPEKSRVYLFGHSRGAFTVRSVAGMIRNCGILKMGFEDGDAESSSALALVEEVYRIYTSKEPEYAPDQPAVKCFMERMSHNLQRPPVEFMGLLDTVGDLGVPKLNSGPGVSYEFYDTDVSRDVLHVWQGLAVHDRLTFFTPCHITRKKEDQPAVHCSCCCCSAAGDAATTPAAEQLFRYPEYVDLYTTVETWLPGAHYDCGRQNFVFLRQVGGWEGWLSFVNWSLNPWNIDIDPNKALADVAMLELVRHMWSVSQPARDIMLGNPLEDAGKERYLKLTEDPPSIFDGLLNTIRKMRPHLSQDAYDKLAVQVLTDGLVLPMPAVMLGPVAGAANTAFKGLVNSFLPIMPADRHIPLYPTPGDSMAAFVSLKGSVCSYVNGPAPGGQAAEADAFKSKAFDTYRISSGRNLDVCGDEIIPCSVQTAGQAATAAVSS